MAESIRYVDLVVGQQSYSPFENVKETKIGFEGLDLTGFTHLLRTDRDFLIDTAFKDKYSENEIERRKEVQSYRELVGEQDYYYPAKS